MTSAIKTIRAWLSDDHFLEMAGVATGAAVLLLGSLLGALSLLPR